MPVKLSEKKMLLSVLCLAAGLLLLINTTLISTPIRISEKGIVLLLSALMFIGFGTYNFKNAMVKV